jgi:hypothetical protein
MAFASAKVIDAAESTRDFVGAGMLRVIAESFNRVPVNEVFVHYCRSVFGFHSAVPDVVGVNNHHGAVAALVHASRMVDSYPEVQAGFLDELLQTSVDFG